MSPRFITGGADQTARLWDISLPLITTVPFMDLPMLFMSQKIPKTISSLDNNCKEACLRVPFFCFRVLRYIY
ncbi:hypothetical protein HID58_058022 [Brassica napus]|uniref:Uncharacterized protein n=1 Tax=Brassica napus TaxID=3708 RepID=A0ABQ7ZNV0_BRANA|nr:hypothetical protein HID58_058022 [Brassica napus]